MVADLIKSVLSFSFSIFYFYILGFAVVDLLLLEPKLKIKKLNSYLQFFIYWWFGFGIYLLTIFFLVIISEVKGSFLIYQLNKNFLLLFLIPSLGSLVLRLEEIQFRKILDWLKENWEVILVGTIFAILIISLGKIFIDYRSFGHEFSHPSTHLLPHWRLKEFGFFSSTSLTRTLDWFSEAIAENFFYLKPLTLQWFGGYFLYFCVFIGTYFFVSFYSKNLIFNILTAFISANLLAVTLNFGHGLIDSFRSNYFLKVWLIFYLIAILNCRNYKLEINSKSFLVGIFIFALIFIDSISYGFFRIHHDILTFLTRPLIASLIFGVLVFFLFKNEIVNFILFSSFLSYFIQEGEWLFFVMIVWLFAFLNLRKNNEQNIKIAIKIALLFLLFLLMANIFNILPDFSFITLKLRGFNYQELNFFNKIKQLKIWWFPFVFILAIPGVWFSFEKNLNWQILSLLFLINLIFFFLPMGVTYRIPSYFFVFYGIMSTLTFWKILSFFKKQSRIIFLIGFSLLGLMMALHIFLVYYSHPGSLTFSKEEYQTAEWLRNNLPHRTAILTDWFSYFVFAPLANKIYHLYQTMNPNLGGAYYLDKAKWVFIREKIFKAENSKEAWEAIKLLSKTEDFTYPGELRYMEILKRNNEKKTKYIILLTSRTTTWFDLKNNKTKIIPPMLIRYKLHPINQNNKYFQLFSDPEYFTKIYNLDNKIFVFGVNPEPGVPFEF